MSGITESRASTVVAILSSNYLLRLGLQRIVEAEKWIRLIGHSYNGTACDDLFAHELPQIMIVDTEITNDMTALVQKIKRAAPRIRIILLSGLQDLSCTRQSIDFGVDGIVLKVQPSAVLIATIQYLSHAAEASQSKPSDASDLGIAPSPAVCQTKWPDGLTEREREVVRLISQGLSNKDIADRLCISSITVRHHLTNIFDKLGVSNRQKLLIRAHQYGLVGPMALA